HASCSSLTNMRATEKEKAASNRENVPQLDPHANSITPPQQANARGPAHVRYRCPIKQFNHKASRG
ncbi:MAG: hypothetical protein ACXVCM_22805, partial [Ktedonobacteraceae bacterium]